MSFYVYDLPDPLIQAIKAYTGEVEYQPDLDKSDLINTLKTSEWTPGVCSTCGKFEGSTRDHYKTDYHRYNLKRKVKNLAVLSEKQFEDTIGDLDESISGSGSDLSDLSDSEETNNDSSGNPNLIHDKGSPMILFDLENDSLNTVKELLKSSKRNSKNHHSENSTESHPPSSQKDLNELKDQCLAIYKPILNDLDKPIESLLKLKTLKSSHSVVIMIGGGHFSGAVIAHTPTKQLDNATNPYASINILEHKTFHRYTTRRKQGGSQAASDSAKGKANSAGSSLRRYNQSALEQEVRELLGTWRHYIDSCANIFIRATGNENRAALMNYEKAPIVSTDHRIKTIPFTTKRATGTEIKRCWKELTRARIMPRPEVVPNTRHTAAAKSSGSSSRNSSPMPSKKSATPVSTLTPEEKHTNEIISLIKKGKAPRLIAYLKMNKLSVDFMFEPANYITPNALFYASAHNHKHIVTSLLTNKADPTLKNPANKTAFELATDLDTREAFQVFRHEHPDMYDWDKAAKVGPPISKQELETRQRLSKLELEQEQAQKLEKLKQSFKEETVSSSTKGRLTTKTQESSVLGLSDEARMKLERERRARAAEARLRKA